MFVENIHSNRYYKKDLTKTCLHQRSVEECSYVAP